ncbi:MAG: ZIP family metal transporter [Maricaulaceae bacterium]|jgi:zinc transporter ZupT
MAGGIWAPLAAAALAAAVTTAGLLAIRRFENWARTQTTYFACFAAGVLVTVSFLHIAPESFAMTPQAPAFLLAGYAAMHLFNRFLSAYVCDKPATAGYAIGLVPLVGIGFHSLVDGVVYAVSFSVSALTGVLATAGLILHEFPEGVVTYSLLLRGGFSGRTAFRLAFFASALTTPAGALVAYPFVNALEPERLGALLALSAGVLIYTGATHLLPTAEREPQRYSLLALAAGVIVALGILAAHG